MRVCVIDRMYAKDRLGVDISEVYSMFDIQYLGLLFYFCTFLSFHQRVINFFMYSKLNTVIRVM